MTDEITRQDGESFRDFHDRAFTESARRDLKSRNDRRRVIADMLRIETHQILELIDLNSTDDARSPHTGSYLIHYRQTYRNAADNREYWATIVNGLYDWTIYNTRPMAMLHALARELGQERSDAMGSATFAARTLGLPADDLN